MAGVNKAIIVGNLGNDPEIRTMPNGHERKLDRQKHERAKNADRMALYRVLSPPSRNLRAVSQERLKSVCRRTSKNP